jgi:hypothetical protein
VYDYLLGGTANFPVDRAAAEQAYGAFPGGLDGVKADIRNHRALLGRVVRYLADQAGIRQFLDIGTGIPKENNTHEVAQRVNPRSRIVYVDNDPIVLAYAHQLLTSTPQGACAYIEGDLNDPGPILSEAARTLDFSEPVAVMLFGVLHFFPDSARPDALLAQLMGSLAPGSYLAISHLAKDVRTDEVTEVFDRLSEVMNTSVALRTQAEVERFFAGLELVEPGVVQPALWHPEDKSSPHEASFPSPMWCGVARKP